MMKPYLKRVAELYHKQDVMSHPLTDAEQKEWIESLDALTKADDVQQLYEVPISFLWKTYRSVGVLCSVERDMWNRAMKRNLNRYWELCKLQQLVDIAHEIGDDGWEQQIRRRIDQLENFTIGSDVQ